MRPAVQSLRGSDLRSFQHPVFAEGALVAGRAAQ